MIIGIDIDEVLAELLQEVLKQNDYYIGGKKLTYNDVVDYYIYNIDSLDISINDAIALFRTTMENDIEKCEVKPCKGVYNKLLQWKNEGHILKAVTARPGDLFEKYTLNWLDKHYPGIFDDVYFTNTSRVKIEKDGKDMTKKSTICKNIGLDIMIEDNWDYAKDIAGCGIKTYLIKKPWNINKPKLKNVIVIDKLEDIDLFSN